MKANINEFHGNGENNAIINQALQRAKKQALNNNPNADDSNSSQKLMEAAYKLDVSMTNKMSVISNEEAWFVASKVIDFIKSSPALALESHFDFSLESQNDEENNENEDESDL